MATREGKVSVSGRRAKADARRGGAAATRLALQQLLQLLHVGVGHAAHAMRRGVATRQRSAPRRMRFGTRRAAHLRTRSSGASSGYLGVCAKVSDTSTARRTGRVSRRRASLSARSPRRRRARTRRVIRVLRLHALWPDRNLPARRVGAEPLRPAAVNLCEAEAEAAQVRRTAPQAGRRKQRRTLYVVHQDRLQRAYFLLLLSRVVCGGEERT